MTPLLAIPEIQAASWPRQTVRIPDQQDIPLTPRVLAILETEPMQRLQRLRQLGFVALVYPGAVHTRWEHSLGVYRSALLFLRQLSADKRFARLMDVKTAETLIVAALVHDIGHWPYCHPIEDLRLPNIPPHERLAHEVLAHSPIADILERDWQITPQRVCDLLNGDATDDAGRLAASILSGPIDVDKIDYLYRDSLHCGVPYGRNFDSPRLINSLTLNRNQTGIAITRKGRTAAELMVFARYVMFSEVYWHHAVRSATAMLQRAFFGFAIDPSAGLWWRSTDDEFPAMMRTAAAGLPVAPLVEELFGTQRQLYKRWEQFSFFDNPRLYEALARQPYAWLVRCSEQIAQELARELQLPIKPIDILLDAPPVGVEVQFKVEVWDEAAQTSQALGKISPVVSALAERQFDDYVKQIRLFVHPRWRHAVQNCSAEPILRRALTNM